MLDAFVAAEGEPEVLQFSGGEPTIHKDILTFIEMAQQRGIKSVMLNTNGISPTSCSLTPLPIGARWSTASSPASAPTSTRW